MNKLSAVVSTHTGAGLPIVVMFNHTSTYYYTSKIDNRLLRGCFPQNVAIWCQRFKSHQFVAEQMMEKILKFRSLLSLFV